jgi:uncharacterized membrane protein
MTDIAVFSAVPLTRLDLAAMVWFLAAFAGYAVVLGLPQVEKRSVVGAIQAQRIAWMHNMVSRENRMMDAVVMTQLGQGNAFFASTSAIAIGGLAALLGSGERLLDVLQRLPLSVGGTPALIEMKTLLLMAIFVYAFFKFAWAFRLSHYCSIMIGAAPSATAQVSEQETHAVAVARLIGIAADHTNSGIRSFYYAIAAMAWYFHPLLFILATTWVLLIMIRRDFFSRSRRVVAAAGGMP